MSTSDSDAQVRKPVVSSALQESTQMESRGGLARAAPPRETTLQYRGRVVVGQDGSGVTADRFATTASGDRVRYVMLIENGGLADDNAEAPDDPAVVPAPVRGITVTLNDDVVFQNEELFRSERIEVALNPIGPQLNSIVLAATGAPRSAARVVVLATRPIDVFFAGRSVLPWALIADRVRTFLAIHNADAADIGVRIAFFEPDGSVAGRTAPERLARHATVNLDLNAVAQTLGLSWTRGAVHVEWVARGPSRLSTVASEERSKLDADGTPQVIAARTLALDDFRPHPVTEAVAEEFLGIARGAR